MSDLARSCPACDSYASEIGRAFRDGEPCPDCGLPADAAEAFDRAVDRGVAEDVARRMAEAERRAVGAEAEAGRLLAILDRIRRALP